MLFLAVLWNMGMVWEAGARGGGSKRQERSKEINFSWLLFLDFPFLLLSGHLHLMISFALHQWLVIWSVHDAWFLPIGHTYLLGLGLQFCLFLTVPLSQTRTPSLIRCCYSPHGIQFLSYVQFIEYQVSSTQPGTRTLRDTGSQLISLSRGALTHPAYWPSAPGTI